jgi:phytoene dehydrogenase-like protein
MTAEGKRACVIGAGFGGLALAIRLQAAGVATTLVEARDKPGGRAYHWQRDGFTFDAGPTVITDPACLRELWALTGHDMARDVELLPVNPFYRLNWPDGTTFDTSNDHAQLRREIARLDPADLAGYDAFLDYSAGGLSRWLRPARRRAVPQLRLDDQGGARAGQTPRLALGLRHGRALRRQRQAAPGAVVPHAAGRRQSLSPPAASTR